MGKRFICIFILTAMFLASCTSTGKAGVEQSVLEHQRELAEYQARVDARERTIAACIEEITSIRERAGRMEGKIDDVIQLFDEYQRAVERLLYEIDTRRVEKQTIDQNTNNAH